MHFGKPNKALTNLGIVLLLILFWIPCLGQDSVKVNRREFLDVLISEAEYKAEVKSLRSDTLNLRAIINTKDVVIGDLYIVVANHEEIQKGLENALKSLKDAYKDAIRDGKRKWLKGILTGILFGAGVMAGLFGFGFIVI